MSDAPYLPQDLFAGDPSATSAPRAFISPARYVQGDGVLDRLGRYLALIPSHHAGVIVSDGGWHREGERIRSSLAREGVEYHETTFGGECSLEEIGRLATVYRSQHSLVDSIITVGGGKCVDAGKAVAYRLGVPAVICPTLASNDAPCSALSVLYEASGVFEGVEFFEQSPAIVLVDTGIVARAPTRYLVAGMGDAMATWYEARTAYENPDGISCLGARPTIAAYALAERCAETLYACGRDALADVTSGRVSLSLEQVVEANTLLSGLGFESGGIALAHCVAQGLTVVPHVHREYLHGEMVAIGLLTQLHAEGNEEEAGRVAAFFADVGLPVSLEQLSLSSDDEDSLRAVAEIAVGIPFVANEPMSVSVESLIAAFRRLDEHGTRLSDAHGQEPYQALR